MFVLYAITFLYAEALTPKYVVQFHLLQLHLNKRCLTLLHLSVGHRFYTCGNLSQASGCRIESCLSEYAQFIALAKT